MPDLLDLWPSLDRLDRVRRLLARLEALPASVGPIDFAAVRDVTLPLPADWPVASTATGSPPERVDAAWLAAVLRSGANGEPTPSRLWRIARTLRARPAWSLTCLWLLESAVAWPDALAATEPGLLADLGELHCQTGDLIEGVALLDRAAEQGGPAADEFALRAARWVALINADTASGRLVRLRGSTAGPVRTLAELELLALESPGGGRDDLLDRAARIDAVVARAGQSELSEDDRRRLAVRANQVVGRWFVYSQARPFREAGVDRLLRAARGSREAGDFPTLTRTLDLLGRARLRAGSFDKARAAFEESASLRQQLRDLWGLGASLTGLAECLLAAGMARESIPYFQANLLLLDQLGGLEVLFVRYLARHLNALVAAGCNPLEIDPPANEIVELAAQLRHHYRAFTTQPERDPICLLLEGGYRRLAARRAESAEQRQEHLAAGLSSVENARTLSRREGSSPRVAEAARVLAALLLDGVGMSGRADPAPLRRAREALEDADQNTKGEQARLQTELLWARYHQLAGSPYQMQMHLAAARRAAEASGLRAMAVEVDSHLGVRLSGPASFVALPGETIPLEIRAADWRGRPLPSFVLQTFVEAETGPVPEVTPARQETDYLGRVRFDVRCSAPARAVFHVATPDGVHAVTVRLVARDVGIEWTTAEPPLSAAHERLLRQLFGPDCPRLCVQREFTTGRTATRVLLVEPFRDGEDGEELRGQPCIVKLGPRALLEDEQARYRQWVKELLPVNVSRLDGFAAWQDEAALRLGLVGDASRGQVREACEWLASADAFDAHLLLERVFVGDLAVCWYANNPRHREAAPLAELYGPMTPCLLHLEDESPPRGLCSRGGSAQGVRVEEGIRPAAARSFRAGDEVTVQGARVLSYAASNGSWEYELRLENNPLRITFRTSLSPEQMEPDGSPERLLDGRTWAVRGRVRGTAFDRLTQALRNSLAVFNATHPDESVSLTDDGRHLLFCCSRSYRRVSNPLDHLGRLLAMTIPCHWSLIHGDLHGRNVLVGPQGQPFYVDFARTGYGPTLFDFIKFEVYLWHENFADWPVGPSPVGLADAIELLDDLAASDSARHFPSPYARRGQHGRLGWAALFRQCVATIRSAARPYVLDAAGADYFVPLTLYVALMLRWCDPDVTTEPARRRVLARQGVFHALAAGALLDGVLARG